MNALETDVTVVGAGLAGLTAARRFEQAGLDVCVLEARDRVGGRTHTRELDGQSVDFGARWIGSGQPYIQTLVDELGIKTTPQYNEGPTQIHIGDESRTFERTFRALSPLAMIDFLRGVRRLSQLWKQVPTHDPTAAEHAQEWDSETVATWRNRQFRTEGAKRAFDCCIRLGFACEPDELSFLFFLYDLSTVGGLYRMLAIEGGAHQTRLVGGTQRLSTRIKADLEGDVLLSEPVRRIERNDIVVYTDNCAVEAEYAVVAVPPAQAGQIEYEPTLPPLREEFTRRVPMGAVVTCVVAYDEPFWREHYSGTVITDQEITAVFDGVSAPEARSTIVAYALGDAAKRLRTLSLENRRKLVLDRLTEFFGSRAKKAVAYGDEIWTDGRWNTGCWAGIMPPGVLSRYTSVLQSPVGRVHWAGTETATQWNGYMEGAVTSAHRVVDEILSRRSEQDRH